MSQLYVLFEHASGYALFQIAEFEEVETLIHQVLTSLSDVSKFRGIVNLVSFSPFKTGLNALENMNSISEGILHNHLQLFLENHMPKSKGKNKATLGVQEPKLAAAISESLEISCTISGAVPEIIRGIRLHFHKLIKGFKDLSSANKAQLGLGHHYSRARVKFNVNRIDNMIIQSISLVDQLDKDINTFSMRVREWYSHHFPELIKIVPENNLFIRCVQVIQDRKNMPEDIEEQLEQIIMDSGKAHNVIEVARSSMGMEISPLDMVNVTVFAHRIVSLMERRKELMEYLKSKMHSVAPNLAALIGDMVGARLIAHAGSLINLAKFPASTVQILGAEKALFRALKTRGNTPKYGLIYHSTFIGRAGKTNKGRISRYLANKCSVASRIDCFREVPTEVFGQKLRQQVEDRLKFYETGTLPAKNVDVMTEALAEAEIAEVAILKDLKKAKKREKKRRQKQMGDSMLSMGDSSMNLSAENPEEEMNDEAVLLKKIKKEKKLKKKLQAMESSINGEISNVTTESLDVSMEPGEMYNGTVEDEAAILKKLKKAKKREKRKLQEMQNSLQTSGDISLMTGESMNASLEQDEEIDGAVDNENSNIAKKMKKKKKKKSQEE